MSEEPKQRRPRGVVDGVLWSTSPTDIQRADPGSDGGCYRKWWYGAVAKLPRKPDTVNQKRGNEGHAELHGYLAGGERPARSDVVRGMHRVPKPGPDLVVETYIEIELEGVVVVTKMDCAHMRGSSDPDTGALDPEGTVEVKDWKFPKDLQYVGDHADVPRDLQMALYGEYWFRRGIQRVRLTKENFVKTPASVHTRSFLAEYYSDISPAIDRARATIRAMKEVARIDDSEAVPFNRSACRRFGGCDFADTCTIPTFDPLQQILGERATMGIISDLKNKRAAADAAADPATAEAAAKKAAQERRAALGEDLIEAISFLREHPQGYPPLIGRAAQAWAAEQLKTVDPSVGYAGQWEMKGFAAVENPDDLIALALELAGAPTEQQDQAAESTPAQQKLLDDAAKAADQKAKADALAAARSHPASVTPPDAPASNPAAHVEAAESKDKKRKDKTEKARDAADEADGKKPSKAKAKEPEDYAPLVLVDCVPVSGEFVGQRLEPYCYDLLKAIAGGADIRMSNGEDFGFGKWRPAIEAAACHKLPLGGTWLLDSRMGELAESVIAGLIRAGVTVIRGHR